MLEFGVEGWKAKYISGAEWFSFEMVCVLVAYCSTIMRWFQKVLDIVI